MQLLNNWDRALLDDHLDFYEALHSGARSPETRAQAHFVEVLSGCASPKTQHEIAYVRYLASEDKTAVREVQDSTGGNIVPSEAVIAVVDSVEEAEFTTSSPAVTTALEQVAGRYRSGVARAKNWVSDGAIWATALLSEVDISQGLEQWMAGAWGGLSNVYTRAMDGAYLEGLKPGQDYVAPWLHRIFEGHSLPDSWTAVKDALPDDTFSQEVVAWLQALGSDVATRAGLPVATVSPDQLEAIQGIATHFGITESWLLDALTFTGTEVVACALPGIALALNWNEKESSAFARVVGSIGVGAAAAANPVLGIIALAALARVFQQVHYGDDPEVWLKGMVSGGLITGTVLTASAFIGGPVAVGLLAGVGLVVGAQQLGKKTSVTDVTSWLQSLLPASATA